jgi:hypothetical protein
MAGMLRSMDVNLLAHLATFVRDRLGETVPPPDGVAEAALEARLLNLQTAVLDLNTSMINVPPAPQPPAPTTDMTRTGLLDAQIAAGTYAFVATGGAPGAGSTPWRTRPARTGQPHCIWSRRMAGCSPRSSGTLYFSHTLCTWLAAAFYKRPICLRLQV